MKSDNLPKGEQKIEDLWFAQHEKNMLEEIARIRKKRMEEEELNRSQEELKALKDAHWMKCPKCGHDMENIEIEGVVTDKCSFCEGLYFDHGELQELLQRHDEKKKGVFKTLLGLKGI